MADNPKFSTLYYSNKVIIFKIGSYFSSDTDVDDLKKDSSKKSSSGKVKISLSSPSSSSKTPNSKPRLNTSGLEGNLHCRFCDYTGEKAANIKNHTLNHFKDQLFPMLPSCVPFLCPECNNPHRDKISLLRHFAFSHNKVNTALCSRIFQNVNLRLDFVEI